MNTGLVSVVIPMYNSKKTILRTIESVLNQIYQRIEIIVIDDGSVDNSFEIVLNLVEKNKIKLIRQENKGPSAARNLGIKNSNGEFIAFLDSDDYWHEDKISNQIEVFEKNKEVGIVATRVENKNYSQKIEDITFRKYLFSIHGFNINTPTVIVKRKVIEDIGYFNENMKYSEDAEYWLRILKKYRGIMINKNLVDCGNGKKIFGESGLSANIDEMSKGIYYNYKSLLKSKQIRKYEFIYLLVLLFIKHLRRKLITNFRGKKCTYQY